MLKSTTNEQKYLFFLVIGILATYTIATAFKIPAQIDHGTFLGQQQVNSHSSIIPAASAAGILTNVFVLPSNNIFSSKSYYTITFTTATTGTIKTIDMTFPAGFNVASAKLIEAQGIGAGSLSVLGQVVTYTVSSPVSVPAPRAVKIMIADITNAVTVSNQVSIITKDIINLIDGPTPSAAFTLIQVTNPMIGTSATTDTKIAADAIDSSKIKNGQVFRDDLADNAVTSEKVQNGAIRSDDLGPGVITAEKLGFNSVTNTALAPGLVTRDKIASGAINPIVTERSSGSVSIEQGDGYVSASCNADEVATGGGFRTHNSGVVVRENFFDKTSNGWMTHVVNSDTYSHYVETHVRCLKLLP